jgi:hypothetical protein
MPYQGGLLADVSDSIMAQVDLERKLRQFSHPAGRTLLRPLGVTIEMFRTRLNE